MDNVIEYLMIAGNDIVKETMPMTEAVRIVRSAKLKTKSDRFKDFPVMVDETYFFPEFMEKFKTNDKKKDKK